MPTRLSLALAVAATLAACDQAGGDSGRLGQACDSCLRTADCELPLRCRSGICVDLTRPDACAAGDAGADAPERAEACSSLCRDAAACGAIGAGRLLCASASRCWEWCVATASELELSCLGSRIGARQCGDASLGLCMAHPPCGEGEGEGEGPAEGEGEGPAEGEGEGPAEGEGEGAICTEEAPDSRACRCEDFCDAGGECGMFFGWDPADGSPMAWCRGECQAMTEETLACMERLVTQGTCTDEALEACLTPVGPDEELSEVCAGFCGWADGCGMLGDSSPFAASVVECKSTCASMAAGSPSTQACLRGVVAAGECGEDAAIACIAPS